jgi:hypothetical protein
VRIKSVILSIFAVIILFAAVPFVSADDFTDTLQITWEKVKEPFFDKYNPFGTGARAIGMGEAFSAIADDSSTVYYNPAGLAQMDHNEIFWTGGSYYGGVPYTGFASFTMALGGQYFGLSYEKLYHPIGRYPEKVVIPVRIGNAGVPPPTPLFYTENIDITVGTYDWFGGAGMGGLDPSWQEFLGDKYRKYINLPFQTNSVLLTYATPLTSDKSFNFGVNVKYMFTDADAKKIITDEFDAWSWGLDVGFLYKLRLIEFLKDLNISIMLRDVSGQMKRYKTGIEKNLFFTSTIGLSMRTTQLIEKEVTSFSVDFNSVNDPGVLEQERYRFNFGAEQWFIDGHFAVRGGLVDVMYPGTWRASLGLSAKYIFGIDYAYVFGVPLGQDAENESDSHWISLHWEWGKVVRKLPTPDVFAAVEPISFAPKNGETVIFKLNADSKAGIDRWALNILDKNNNLVKSYVDIGAPPSQIIWNGTDNKYQPLSDGEYTFIFEATDKLGSTASTPVQTVKLFTPVLEAVNKEALNKLKILLKQIGDRDLAEDNAQMANAKAGVEEWKAIKGKPTPVPPPPAGTIPEPLPLTAFPGFENYQGATPSAAAGNVNVAGFPNVDSSAIRSAYIATDADGNKQFMMEYATANTIPQYVMKEVAMMARSIAESMGGSISNIGINALYGGSNTMAVNVPIAQAQNYSRGYISAEQMLRGANITLNGEIINPNY